jgi:hypothetical protein
MAEATDGGVGGNEEVMEGQQDDVEASEEEGQGAEAAREAALTIMPSLIPSPGERLRRVVGLEPEGRT